MLSPAVLVAYELAIVRQYAVARLRMPRRVLEALIEGSATSNQFAASILWLQTPRNEAGRAETCELSYRTL